MLFNGDRKLSVISFIRVFFSGDGRSADLKRNVALSFVFKGLSILISIMLVPLTLHYLNVTEYGVWLTLSSILTWINFFDVGLGNGLRNKLAEALAEQNLKLARTYVSTAFGLLVIIMLVFFILFFFLQPILNWPRILNVDTHSGSDLQRSIIYIFGFFCLQFVFRLVGIVLLADQKAAMNDLLGVLGSALSLCIIYILTKVTTGSLFYVAIVFSASPVVVFLVAYRVLFFGRYKYLRPSRHFIDFHYSNQLMGLGVKFFIIQISCLVLFSSSNLIIAQLFGASEVTPYNIASRYFSVVIMLFNIVLSPMWSAYTQAYYKGDLMWIRKAMNRMLRLWLISVLLTILMILIANSVFKFWIGNSVKIPVLLTSLTGAYAIISNWNNIFAQMIAGVGKLKLQLINSVLNIFIYILLAFGLGKYMGVEGVVAAMCLTLLTSSFWQPIQCWKLVNNKAKGIWNQ